MPTSLPPRRVDQTNAIRDDLRALLAVLSLGLVLMLVLGVAATRFGEPASEILLTLDGDD